MVDLSIKLSMLVVDLSKKSYSRKTEPCEIHIVNYKHEIYIVYLVLISFVQKRGYALDLDHDLFCL